MLQRSPDRSCWVSKSGFPICKFGRTQIRWSCRSRTAWTSPSHCYATAPWNGKFTDGLVSASSWWTYYTDQLRRRATGFHTNRMMISSSLIERPKNSSEDVPCWQRFWRTCMDRTPSPPESLPSLFRRGFWSSTRTPEHTTAQSQPVQASLSVLRAEGPLRFSSTTSPPMSRVGQKTFLLALRDMTPRGITVERKVRNRIKTESDQKCCQQRQTCVVCGIKSYTQQEICTQLKPLWGG